MLLHQHQKAARHTTCATQSAVPQDQARATRALRLSGAERGERANGAGVSGTYLVRRMTPPLLTAPSQSRLGRSASSQRTPDDTTTRRGPSPHRSHCTAWLRCISSSSPTVVMRSYLHKQSWDVDRSGYEVTLATSRPGIMAEGGRVALKQRT